MELGWFTLLKILLIFFLIGAYNGFIAIVLINYFLKSLLTVLAVLGGIQSGKERRTKENKTEHA